MLNIFNTIIEMNIKASVVILFILIVRLFIKNAPKKFSYMLWAVAAFRLCIPYSFKTLFSLFNVGGKESIGEQISHTVEQIPTYVPNVPVEAPIVNNTVNTIVNTPIHTPSVSTPPINTPVTTPNIDISQTSGSEIVNAVAETSIDWGVLLMQIALVLWILGLAAMFIYGIVTYIKTHRRMQNRILSRDNIYFSDKIETPFSMGFIKPKIYLPFGLSDEEQECIIAHEECHIKRFDHIVKLFSYLLLCVHWFNPMCWVAFNRMTYDMETSCDEMVFAKGITEEKKKQYSHTLVKVGTKKRFPTPAPINFDGISNTKSRIKNILKLRKTKVWIKVICYILCAVVLFACAADVSESITDLQSETDSTQSETANTQSETDNSQSETDNKQSTAAKPTGLILEALSNEINIITEDAKEMFLSEYTASTGPDYHKQATIDLDNDGYNEVVLEQEGGAGFLILREFDRRVYLYNLTYRGFLHLKTDGTYFGTSGMSDHGIYKMSFNGNKIEGFTIAKSQYVLELDKEVYTIYGESVSADEYNDFYDKWSNKEEVVFTARNESITILQGCNGKEYTATVIFEEDKAYLNICCNDDEYRLPIDFYNKDNINKNLIKPYAVDVTFGGIIDIVVPVKETGSAIYYSAFIFDYKTEKFKYVPHFESFPNFVLDTENQRILAHRQGDMSSYYAYCTYNSDVEDFETTNSVFFECVNTENYTYEFTESKTEGGVWTDVAKYTLMGDGYYSVRGINQEIDETYYNEGSFWELDSPKWRGESGGNSNESEPPVSIEVPDEEALNNGKYNTFIEHQFEGYGDTMLFVATEKVTDFKVISIDVNDDFDPLVGKTLYYQPELTPDGIPLYVLTHINSMSFRGIQYTENNGIIRTFRIVYDHRGESEKSFHLEEIRTNDVNDNTNNSLATLFEIGIANDEMISDENNIRFIDDYGENNTWHVYVRPNYHLTDFRFFVIDDGETMVISRTMYAIDSFNANDTFIASTYINDVTCNRGFGFIDQNGKQRYFAIVCDMSGISESPIEAVEITDFTFLTKPYYDFESIALSFYNAYMQNDIETAKALMDSPDNECLEYFSNSINEYNSIKRGRISLSNVINDNSGNITEANLDIAFSDTREGYENTDYMVMTLKNIDNKWVITYYDFDA